jgi:hypothetical protein
MDSFFRTLRRPRLQVSMQGHQAKKQRQPNAQEISDNGHGIRVSGPRRSLRQREWPSLLRLQAFHSFTEREPIFGSIFERRFGGWPFCLPGKLPWPVPDIRVCASACGPNGTEWRQVPHAPELILEHNSASPRCDLSVHAIGVELTLSATFVCFKHGRILNAEDHCHSVFHIQFLFGPCLSVISPRQFWRLDR